MSSAGDVAYTLYTTVNWSEIEWDERMSGDYDTGVTARYIHVYGPIVSYLDVADWTGFTPSFDIINAYWPESEFLWDISSREVEKDFTLGYFDENSSKFCALNFLNVYGEDQIGPHWLCRYSDRPLYVYVLWVLKYYKNSSTPCTVRHYLKKFQLSDTTTDSDYAYELRVEPKFIGFPFIYGETQSDL